MIPKDSYFEDQLVFYGSYHHNKVNIVTHIICVPLIFWSLEVGLSNLGLNIGLVSLFGYDFGIYPGSLLAIAYCVYYIILDPVAGTIYTPLLLLKSQHAFWFAAGNPNAGKIALIVHIGSWIAQFLSHGLAEKRAPALFDGLVQAATLAPLFVFLEVLFCLGYKPELQKRVSARASKNIGKYRASLLHKAKEQ